MVIAIDFDGTCVTHEFPEVGKDIGAARVLKKLVESGHQLILYTMRSDDPEKNRYVLSDARKWFEQNNILLYGVNKNPTQDEWTSSPKTYAQLYIDDAALGIPLKFTDLSDRPYVDWFWVEKLLQDKGILC